MAAGSETIRPFFVVKNRENVDFWLPARNHQFKFGQPESNGCTLPVSDSMEAFVASLAKEHDDLSARIRAVSHSVHSQDELVKLHAHFLAFRGGNPTVEEFIQVLSFKLVPFCLHRKYIDGVQGTWSSLSPNKVQQSALQLNQKAIDLFKRAQKNTNRNGEFGELIIYLMIESILKAPQFVAKMSLKTSPQMPVHGSDGIHLSYSDQSGQLWLYWGESKCYSSIQEAIDKAAESVADNLQHKKMAHELFLVEQYFDLAGFPEDFREAILSFLNPFDENYNKRADVSVILIAFDFATFAKLKELKPDEIEPHFVAELRKALSTYVNKLDASLKKHGVNKHSIEVFFLPVPSISTMRTLFQDKIGWR